jgi:cysteine-rich repeat protein
MISQDLCVSRARTPFLCLAAVLGCLSVAACGDDDTAETGNPITSKPDTGTGEDSGTKSRADCRGAKLGDRCGEDGQFCVNEKCVWNSCGDGVKAGDEACDDGNVAADDDCDPDCRIEQKGCGDAVVSDSEECDDGNTVDLDSCSNKCMKNQCGNQRVDSGEECDDGNRVDDDDCTNACTEVRCRNGRIDAGEECDDGNQIDNDGCTNACKVMICGDGKKQAKEECDDGNTSSDDGCSSTCKKEFCGDGIKQANEQCDAPGSSTCDPGKCTVVVDTCTPCERLNCSKSNLSHPENMANPDPYGDLDLPGGCYDNEPSLDLVHVKPAKDAFSGPCKALVSCLRKEQCLAPEFLGGAVDECYCQRPCTGDLSVHFQECIMNGPDYCRDEFYAASGTSVPAVASAAYSVLDVPAGWAYYLFECSRKYCKEECKGFRDADPAWMCIDEPAPTPTGQPIKCCMKK